MSSWTASNIPDQNGRVVVVTGANSGIGFETAAAFASRGAHVVLAVRNLERGAEAAARITAKSRLASLAVQKLDLGSLQSIRAAAGELKATYPSIDVLINNAGLMWTDKDTTADGFELQFGTDHLGHFALTGLLLENLLHVRGSRVVTVSSIAHRIKADIHFDDLQWERTPYNRVAAYGQAKLANLMFTYELERRLANENAQTIAVAAHPGGSKTGLLRSYPRWTRLGFTLIQPIIGQSPAMGALPTLRAATDPAISGGQYLGPRGVGGMRGYPVSVRSRGRSHDAVAHRRLWTASEELTGVTFPSSTTDSAIVATPATSLG